MRNLAAVFLTIIFSKFVLASGVQTPYRERFDISLVEQALKTPPEKLVGFIEAQGVRVFKVKKSLTLKKPANPIFAKTKIALGKDLERCDIDVTDDNSEDGRFLQRDQTFCESDYDWIYIADTSSSITLIHEFMHFLFYKTEDAADREISGNVAENLRREHRFMMKNYEALSSDSELLRNDHYRNSFAQGCLDFSKAFLDGVRVQLSEEIIIERILEKLTVGTRYADSERIEKGKKYVQNNLNTVAEMMVEFQNIVTWLSGERGVLVGKISDTELMSFDLKILELVLKNQEQFMVHQKLTDYTPTMVP